MEKTAELKKDRLYSPKQILEEAEEYLREINPDDSVIPASWDTVADMCLSWLQYRKSTVKRSTYSCYSYCVAKHILPSLGKLSLPELTEETLSSFKTDMKGLGLAETTIRSVLVTLKSILKYGGQTGLLDRELTSLCAVNCRRPESRMLTVQESTVMKDYLLDRNSVFSAAILLCRGTGIRIGELCGLKWGDINFRTNTMCIRRTVSRIPNPDTSVGQPKTILYIRAPKSHTSAREIPIPQYLAGILAEMKKEDDLYLLTGAKTCTEPRNVQKKFKTILKHCNMEDCNFHAMRHGFATACLEKGVDCKTVSSILGHASTRTTMEFYVHTSMRQKQDCIDKIE